MLLDDKQEGQQLRAFGASQSSEMTTPCYAIAIFGEGNHRIHGNRRAWNNRELFNQNDRALVFTFQDYSGSRNCKSQA